jgi:hypothetical protein
MPNTCDEPNAHPGFPCNHPAPQAELEDVRVPAYSAGRVVLYQGNACTVRGSWRAGDLWMYDITVVASREQIDGVPEWALWRPTLPTSPLARRARPPR